MSIRESPFPIKNINTDIMQYFSNINIMNNEDYILNNNDIVNLQVNNEIANEYKDNK